MSEPKVWWRCWGCGVRVEAPADSFPRCETPKCNLLMDRLAFNERDRRAARASRRKEQP